MRSIRIEGGPIVREMRVVDSETGEGIHGVTGFKVWGRTGELCRAELSFTGVEYAVIGYRVWSLRRRIRWTLADWWSRAVQAIRGAARACRAGLGMQGTDNS